MKKRYPIPYNDFPNDPELTELYNRWIKLPPPRREEARLKIRALIKSYQPEVKRNA